jgi:iron complex transport system substrate-binding protein
MWMVSNQLAEVRRFLAIAKRNCLSVEMPMKSLVSTGFNRVHAAAFAVALLAVCMVGARPLWADDVPKPLRIVSLNMCLDQLLVDLVPRERIAAVSYLAKDASLTAATERFDGLTTVRGTAEEVLALNPDLILVGEYTTGATVALLRRLGQNVAVVPMAQDFAAMRQSIRTIAAHVGETARGEAMIAGFDKRLEAVRQPMTLRPTALAYQVNSLVSGPNSLMHAAIEAAGYTNLAGAMQLGPGGRLPLEALIATPPDLVILANGRDDFRTVVADNLRHPALAELLRTRAHAHLPMPMWMCATPRIAGAVEELARALPQSDVAGVPALRP